MSFKAVLKIGEKNYNVLVAEYKFHQEVDATGRPSSITRGGKIHVTIESSSDTMLIESTVDSFDRKSGSITFSKRDTDATMKKVEFEEAYLTSYEEKFDSTGVNPLTETFTLSAKKITVNNAVHENEWDGSLAK